MVKIVRFHQFGEAEVLQLDELPLSEPGKGEVQIKVEAIGLNRAEVAFRQGAYLERPDHFPSTLGYEAAGVKTAKAHQVFVGNGFDQYAPYDLVLDSVGGEILSAVLEHLALDGTCVMFGATAGSNITFNASRFYGKGGLSLYGFILFHELKKQPASVGLAQLVQFVANGLLVPHIDLEEPWSAIADVAQQLTDRRFLGKAVLYIQP